MKTYLGLPNYTNNLKRLGWTDDDLSGFDGGPTDRLVDAIVAWGTLDDIAMRIQDHLARGADHVCVQVLSADPSKVTMSEFEQLSTLIPSL
jgi:hypothetical protein